MPEEKKAKIRLVINPGYAEDVRCKKCQALLFKVKIPLHKSSEPMGIEVKCRRCGSLNRF